jgi:hypothetical protein
MPGFGAEDFLTTDDVTYFPVRHFLSPLQIIDELPQEPGRSVCRLTPFLLIVTNIEKFCQLCPVFFVALVIFALTIVFDY